MSIEYALGSERWKLMELIFSSMENLFILKVLECTKMQRLDSTLTFEAATPQNGQTDWNNSSAIANELFEYVWPFCGVGV